MTGAEPEFEFASSFAPREKHGRTYGELAFAFDVPVYVVPAPLHKDGYVLLVQASMLRDAMSVKTEDTARDENTAEDDDEESLGQFMDGEVPGARSEGVDDDFIQKRRDEDEQQRMWMRTWLSAIYEHLLMNPTAIMTSAPWEPLREYLAHVTTDVDAGALAAWMGITEREAAVAWMREDKRQRAPLRTTLMLLLCAESDSSNQPEKVIREVAAALGAATTPTV